MPNKKFKLIVFLCSLFLCFSFILPAQAKIYFKPNIEIPGMDKFLQGYVKCEPGGTNECGYPVGGESISRYISGIYNYAAIFVGIVAMLMLVLAGWQWLTAAGSSEKINSAKSTISGVMIGLVLLFGGHILLEQINVDLTIVKNLSPAVPTMITSEIFNCTFDNNCNKDYKCLKPVITTDSSLTCPTGQKKVQYQQCGGDARLCNCYQKDKKDEISCINDELLCIQCTDDNQASICAPFGQVCDSGCCSITLGVVPPIPKTP